ncbi:hypothetical protein [Streptomyces sp. NPDC091040]|uniref:FMN-binding protein n=1 Tax=Streptomyces sp. NPDC091040 TaxID=3365972 RepID=UPI00381F8AEF
MKPNILTRSAAGAVATVAVVLPLAACGSSNEDGTQQPSTQPTSSAPSATRSGSAAYKDGTYTVRGVYGGAPSYMTITLTLDDDAITDVTVKPMPKNNDTSRGYQERFAAAVPDEVVGKSIDDLKVGVIAGASGCADGFNDALAKIREQAETSN